MNNLKQCDCGRLVNIFVNCRCPNCGNELDGRCFFEMDTFSC